MIALLFLMLRDLSAGKIPLGYGVNRGMGVIAINNINLTGSGLDTLLPNLNFPLDLQGGNISGLGEEVLQSLTDVWKTSFQPQKQEVKS